MEILISLILLLFLTGHWKLSNEIDQVRKIMYDQLDIQDDFHKTHIESIYNLSKRISELEEFDI
jgi:hypothetical protein